MKFETDATARRGKEITAKEFIQKLNVFIRFEILSLPPHAVARPLERKEDEAKA